VTGNPMSMSSSSRASASHLSASDEQAYLEKWKQLQKYVEPLKRMISKIDKDEGSLSSTVRAFLWTFAL